MKKTDLQFDFPDELIATHPESVSRIMVVGDSNDGVDIKINVNDMVKENLRNNNSDSQANQTLQNNQTISEYSWDHFLELFNTGDVLILNDTKVVPRRIGDILFLSHSEDRKIWQVLFPAKRFKIGQNIELVPDKVSLTLLEKGLPQKVESSIPLSEEFFETYGELALPPYIQKMRDQSKNVPEDKEWYQTHWAEKSGSFAAPTASLHFKKEQLNYLKQKGVKILKITLHVGLGTFLPVHAEDLTQHEMHAEAAFVSEDVWTQIQLAKQNKNNVWALGTTVTRALESVAHGHIKTNEWGFTRLLILPGFEYKVVDRLLTNFHQPESTLLALVYAFAGKEIVDKAYTWAIKNKFRLFSYGDLSVWLTKYKNKINF